MEINLFQSSKGSLSQFVLLLAVFSESGIPGVVSLENPWEDLLSHDGESRFRIPIVAVEGCPLRKSFQIPDVFW